MNPPKIVLHTDVLIDHLIHRGDARSVLRLAMGKFFCYTTVFSAIELFSLARTEKEIRLCEQTLSAMKILGLNARSAKKLGTWMSNQPGLQHLNLLVGGVCLESRLPLLAMQPKQFRGVGTVKVISAELVKRDLSAAEILKTRGK